MYVRGLIECGGRKSLQPTLFRLGEDAARYESVQQFLADSPWDPVVLLRACAERVAPEIGVTAWVVDDTGIAKDGEYSPGVKRQWSGTLGKVDNCQITVSVHAAGQRGTLPLGWALYLPEEWCEDLPRRRKAKIPDEVSFRTKPELACALAEQAAVWEIPRAPILADQAYGDNAAFRTGGMRREPPGADPHARWCGRGRGKPGPYPIPLHRERLSPAETGARSPHSPLAGVSGREATFGPCGKRVAQLLGCSASWLVRWCHATD